MAGSLLPSSSIFRSVSALVNKDEAQAQQVLQNESRINQMEIEIDELATELLALEQPVATDLRFITAATKINNDFERMDDLAQNIAERSISLMRGASVKPLVDIPHLANLVEGMVRKALDAFVKKDADLARTVLVSDDAVDELRDAIYSGLIDHMQNHPQSFQHAVDLIFVARNLERC